MEKRPKMKKTLYIARFCRVFGCQSIENTAKTSVLDWRYSKKRVNYRMLDWKHYKNIQKHCQKQCFGRIYCLYGKKTCKLPSVWLETLEKHCQKQCFGRISYIYIYTYICWSWLPALEHGKIEENTVNSGIFNGWGDKGIGSIVEHYVFDRFYGDKSVGGKWKFLAWEASQGKSENSLAWEAPTRGKSENSLAWGAPTGGESENS